MQCESPRHTSAPICKSVDPCGNIVVISCEDVSFCYSASFGGVGAIMILPDWLVWLERCDMRSAKWIFPFPSPGTSTHFKEITEMVSSSWSFVIICCLALGTIQIFIHADVLNTFLDLPPVFTEN